MDATATYETPSANSTIDQLCVDTIRTLSMDGVQRANSGHPGTPMALAPLAHRLYSKHLRHDPSIPEWLDRDRFVLSCGHASMLLYSILHLSGYDLSLDDLKNFRQLHSPTAGHPERGEVAGVEFTTGPLGQGVAAAVGMALAERMLAERFNTKDHEVINHRTWVIASDGDLMEGVASEAASLAGHLNLANLCVFWDDNQITIDGTTEISFSEDVAGRYKAYGWNVLELDDVNDMAAIDAVVEAARESDAPTLVVTRTNIGIGSPLQDTSKAHGAPLGDENIRLTKEVYGWSSSEPFHIPGEVRDFYVARAKELSAEHANWDADFKAYKASHAELAAQLERQISGDLPVDFAKELNARSFEDGESMATRQASGLALELLAPAVPELIGGSADLAESNNTHIPNSSSVSAGSYAGRILHFGIREHAMGAIVNGIHAHGGLRAFGATFLIFSDYMRPAIRLSALMGLPSIWVYTHDSVYLGEDGPTHQPIEHLAALRAMPNLVVLRPAEANETLAAWKVALEQKSRPVAIALTRQKLASFTYGGDSKLHGEEVARGAYVLKEATGGKPEAILIATGSEVHLALQAAAELEGDGTPTRVVSMPSWELFAEQPREWQEKVLPNDIRVRVAIEAGSSFGWERYVGSEGEIVAIDRFGLSAPGDQAAKELGINIDSVISATHRAQATVHARN